MPNSASETLADDAARGMELEQRTPGEGLPATDTVSTAHWLNRSDWGAYSITSDMPLRTVWLMTGTGWSSACMTKQPCSAFPPTLATRAGGSRESISIADSATA